MGNEQSSSKSRRSKSKKGKHDTDVAKSTLGGITESLQSGMKKLEESTLLDAVCGSLMDADKGGTHSYGYSEDISEEDSRTLSEDETLDEYDRRRSGKKEVQSESESLVTDDETPSEGSKKRSSRRSKREQIMESASYSEESSYVRGKSTAGKGVVTETAPDTGLSKPLASSFAKRCYFTKAGIGMTTQHYEGLTLTGNVVFMLASAMKLKGCPTICDEDLRRVEQTYPNQFSRLPDELLLSSGWRRISKYCHFSNKPIPDGVPFFHSKDRIHPSGGYYFLLAAAVGMIRPMEVEPLTRDTLVLLETDYPTQCDAAPDVLIEDPNRWTLVDKFCFFSGGPINTEEDVYYQADFDGNLIFMLAFLSPSLTPEELYKLGPDYEEEPGLKSTREVAEVESVYDLTERDFDDLKLYHLGPCRALPPYILQPGVWTKVLPPHFLAAKQQALMKAHDYEQAHGITSPTGASSGIAEGATISSSTAAIGSMNPSINSWQPVAPPHAGNYESQSMAPLPDDEERYDPSYGPPPDVERYPEPYGPPINDDYYPPEAEAGSYSNAPEVGPKAMDGSYAQPHRYTRSHQGMANSVGYHSYAYGSTAGSQVSDAISAEEALQREIEEEGAFIVDSSAPMDEAIASRHMGRMPRPAPPGQGGRGLHPISPPGFIARSDAGSSQIDPPADEPPSLSRRDGPVDEAGFYHEDYMENSPRSDDYSGHMERSPRSDDYSGHMERSPLSEEYSGHDDEHPYDARGGSERGQNGYRGADGYYFEGDSPTDDRDEEYASSPEKDNLKVHTALQQPGDNGRSTGEPGGQQSQFIYSPEAESEFSEGYGCGNDADYYDDSPDEKHRHVDDPTFSTAAPTYDSKQHVDDPTFSPTAESGGYGTVQSQDNSPKHSEMSYASASQSEYSQTSAMRGAQELLRKNRQKRLDMARKHKMVDGGDDELMGRREPKHGDDDASATTSIVSGSSVWTDASQDRSSRRALILQMAKARMKSNKTVGNADDKQLSTPIMEEEPDHEETRTVNTKSTTGIDLARDLD